MLKLILSYTLILIATHSFGQQLFYQDVFYGGVTGAGFSSGVGDGASGQIIVNIDPSSSIKKAYLFCNRYNDAQPVNVTLNSNIYNFNSTNQVGNDFLTFITNDTIICAVHAIDITNDINPLVNTYNIGYPNQSPFFYKYGAFYLLILYENNSFQKTAISIILNEKNATANVSYQINNLLPIDTLDPVGLAIHSDILWNTPNDGSYIYVNSNNIGKIQGSDNINILWSGAGVKGHFYYYNSNLFGLDDDTPDSLMAGTDGLADIKSYIPNNTTNLNIDMVYENNITKYNIYLAYFLSYTTPCDTFSTSISTTNDTICPWGSTQLQATGGSQYSWFGAFGGLSDTSIANPIATPPQTTTYICTITNDSGCVKTEQVKIWVDPCVGIASINKTIPTVNIYPNPTNGNITLTSDNIIDEINIYNLIGTKVFTQTNIANNSINLSLNLPNALYFIYVKTETGVVVKKLVKR